MDIGKGSVSKEGERRRKGRRREGPGDDEKGREKRGEKRRSREKGNLPAERSSLASNPTEYCPQQSESWASSGAPGKGSSLNNDLREGRRKPPRRRGVFVTVESICFDGDSDRTS